MRALVAITILPLLIIVIQILLDLTGYVAYSLYKVGFLVPPLIYCYVYGISIQNQIVKLQNWRRGLLSALGLGAVVFLTFWTGYLWAGDVLIDEDHVVEKIERQFRLTPRTVVFVAPVTIFLNSFLEECFYRGFSFGNLLKFSTRVAYLLPATVYTLAHILFFYQWFSVIPFLIGSALLFAFALVLQRLYVHTESLVAPWIVHGFGAAAMMGVAMMLLRKS